MQDQLIYVPYSSQHLLPKLLLMHGVYADHNLFAALITIGEPAFRKLCDHYYAPLFSLCLLKLRQNEAAQELVMDCLLLLWNQREQVAQLEQPEQWLFQTAHKLAAAARRRLSQKRESYPLQQDPVLPAEAAFLRKLEHRDVRLLFDQALARLTPQQQAILQLTLQGVNRKMIAAQLSISEKTVRNHITSSFRRLRWLLWELYQSR